VGEEVLEAEVIEEAAGPEGGEVAEVRALPGRAGANEVSLWRDEVRSAAIAAAGGLVAP